MNKQQHWQRVYQTKQLSEVSWYQQVPTESLQFVQQLNVPLSAAIIDIGGGDSFLADYLLQAGYTDITVLDISGDAINRAKKRLGENASKINWIVADVLELQVDKKFDCWHDRAAFHFFTTDNEIEQYISTANKHLSDSGKLIMGTFSENGPDKCSGLPVKQYSENNLAKILKQWFTKIKCIHTAHLTPFNIMQQFLFCSFKKSYSHGHS